MPKFQKARQIAFARSDAKCIGSESYLQGLYKPDIILVKWNTFKNAHRRPSDFFSESYNSDICCESSCRRPTLSWRNLLSTIEVKRGNSGGVGEGWGKLFSGKAKEKQLKVEYVGDFGNLEGDRERPSRPSQPAPPGMVNEEFSTRSSTCIALCLSPDSHQLQLRYVLTCEIRGLHPRLQIGRFSWHKRGVEIGRILANRSQRSSEAKVTQDLVGPENRPRKRRVNQGWAKRTNRRKRSRRDRRSKHRGFRVQSTRATRYRLLSTFPTQ